MLICFRPFLLLLLGLTVMSAPATGQTPPDRPACAEIVPRPLSLSGAGADYMRLAEITGLVPVAIEGIVRSSGWPAPSRCASQDSTIWPAARRDSSAGISARPWRLRAARNSAYPRDRNNGALWAGRGSALSLQGGIVHRRGPIRAAIAPVVTWSENLAFRRLLVGEPGYSQFIHPWHGRAIDWPQRFGTDQVTSIHPGDSYIRIDGSGLSAGASTENLWVGPARRNPVLMSNTAPGFPHLFAGTRPPLETVIGAFDVQFAAGLLGESRYWDRNPDNDRRLITIFALSYGPRWAPGLSVGLARVYNEILEPGRLPLDRVLFNLVDIPLLDVVSEEGGNEITSLFARWVFPTVGFEAYGEWTREEDALSLTDFLSEPDYTQGYMLGAQQVIRAGVRWWRAWAEVTHLAPSTPVLRGRPDAPYYTSLSGGQGHTHRGQLLGAWIGPGSEIQAAGVDLFHRLGMIGAYGEHIRFDDATYYEVWSRAYGEARHDAEVTAGVRAAARVGKLEAALDLAWSVRYDRQFVALDGINREPFDEDNRMIDLVLTWRP